MLDEKMLNSFKINNKRYEKHENNSIARNPPERIRINLAFIDFSMIQNSSTSVFGMVFGGYSLAKPFSIA